MITVIVDITTQYDEAQFDGWAEARDYAIRKLHEHDAGNEHAGMRWRDQATKRIIEVPSRPMPDRIYAGSVEIVFAGEAAGEGN